MSWADVFVAIAERSLGAGAAQRPHHERHMVLLHVGTESGRMKATYYAVFQTQR